MSEERTGTGLTILGKLLTIVLIGGLIAGGFFLIKSRGAKGPGADGHATNTGEGHGSEEEAGPAQPAEMKTSVPRLDPAAPYTPKDNTIDVELSEYAGYAGIIAANGGLEPNENSVFFKKHGFKVRLALSEEESWSKLNSGGMAASATTADVLAVYGKQFQVTVPALIGFSRGADGIVVRNEINRINALAGKVLATSQFTEAEFFIRYLAQEAGLAVNAIPDLNATPHPEKVNLVFADDGDTAGDMFLQDLKGNANKLHGFVGWAPKTTEVVDGSGGKARMLVNNKNLLIVADILIVNKGFAQANPKMVAGLVDGLLEGNRMVRDNPSQATLDVVAKGFKWDRQETTEELAKVHLANLPENLAFFSGAIDAAGSWGGIYQSAVFAYGNDLIRDPAPADRFLDLAHLKALEAAGAYKDQKVAIAPIRSQGGTSIEENPLLSKDIRFQFMPNESKLDLGQQENLARLESIKQLLKVSPGSVVLLRGHVDDARVAEFRKQGGESYVRQMSLKAMQLSQDRANEIKRLLIERQGIDPKRIDTRGLGWNEPISNEPNPEKRSELNRRVEVQWFTVE